MTRPRPTVTIRADRLYVDGFNLSREATAKELLVAAHQEIARRFRQSANVK